MTTSHVVVLSIPGLRPGDVQRTVTPTLYEWANRGAMAELTPTFPCVTSPVQASMLTGSPPGEHGVIANGFFDRDRREVAFWVAPNAVIEGEQVFSTVRARRAEFTSAAWHLQNSKGADADYIVTPAPIHEADGTTKLWCYSKPEGLYQELLDELGHFPLQHYWGPRAGIESTRWILQGAARLSRKHDPNLQWIYVPHLDYAAQKHGPNSAQNKDALVELDKELAAFAVNLAGDAHVSDTVYLAVGEYALTDVARVVYPNRLLRQAGLLTVQERDGVELPDLTRSRAFAMVDHQFAHVFVQAGDADAVDQCCDLFSDTSGMAGVFAGDQRSAVGLRHPRSGEIVLIAEDACWFAYYWWLDDAAAPGFARTVDIHRKPGYDPCEMFFDPATGGIPLKPEWVKGSHGVPATAPRHRTAVICSTSSAAVQTDCEYSDTAIKGIALELLGLSL